MLGKTPSVSLSSDVARKHFERREWDRGENGVLTLASNHLQRTSPTRFPAIVGLDLAAEKQNF